MVLRRLMIFLATASLLLASFAVFCTQMGTAMLPMEGQNMSMAHIAVDCTHQMRTCPGDFMQALLQAMPASLVDKLMAFVLFAAVAIFSVLFSSNQQVQCSFQEFIDQILKRLRLQNHRPVFAFAFRRGIIHSKIYA